MFYALQKLDQYVYNSEFVMRTDHKPLKYSLDSPIQNKTLHWTTNLRGYSCTVEYNKGRKNLCTKMLSHLPASLHVDNSDSDLSGPDVR